MNHGLLRRAAALLLLALLGACGGESSRDRAGTTEPRRVARGEFTFELAPVPAWIEPVDVAATWTADAPGADDARWRNWLLDAQIDRRNGARVRYFDNAFEAVSAELVGDAGKYQVHFNPEYQRLVLHAVEVRRDGAWSSRLDPDRITLARRESDFEDDMATGMVTALIVLDDVRAGDVVRLRYSIVGENPVLGGRDSENATFAWTDPILERRLRVLFDRDVDVVEHRSPEIDAAKVTRSGDAQEWLYVRRGVGQLHDEGGYPRWYSPYPSVRIAEKRSWTDVATWARSLYPEPQALPPDLELRLVEWRRIEPLDARVAAVLTAVQEDVRYFGVEIGDSTHKPAEPATTWARRYGDCKDKARLFATLLARLGVEAYPALVSARNGRAIAGWPPGADAFDHVIVQVRLPDATLWLDPTMTLQRGPLRSIGALDAGVALPLAPDAKDLVAVTRPPQTLDRVDVTERFALSAQERGVVLDVSTDFEGAAANRLRRDLRTQGREALQRRYAEYYRRRYGEVRGEGELAVDDDEKSNRVRVAERYTLVDPWASASPAERAIETWVDNLSQEVTMPGTLERRTPLALHYPAEVRQRIELAVPAGWRWQGEEASLRLDDAAAEFESRTEVADGKLTRIQNYRAKADVVESAAIAAHLRWRRQVGDALGRRWVFDLPEKDAGRERDRRLQALLRSLMDEQSGAARSAKP